MEQRGQEGRSGVWVRPEKEGGVGVAVSVGGGCREDVVVTKVG